MLERTTPVAQTGILMCIAAISVGTWSISVSAQSSDCMSAIVSLAPCLGYITGNDMTPSNSCCTQLTAVVQSEVHCLCVILNGGAAAIIGININQTQALALPGACKVQTPPVSNCNSNGVSPSAPSPISPSSPGGDSQLVQGKNSAYGSGPQIPLAAGFSILFTVAYSLTTHTTFQDFTL